MMNVLSNLSNLIIPMLFFFIVAVGLVKGVKVYESFLKGAGEGLKIVVDIVPTLIGLLVAVGMLRASGLFEGLGHLLRPITDFLRLPTEILPLSIVKIFSSIFAGVKKTAKTEVPAPVAAAPAAAAAPALAKGSCGDFKMHDVNPRDAAMAMAIVADKMQTPLNQLRFKSIKKVESEEK